MRVPLRHLDAGVSEDLADGVEIDASGEEETCARVAKVMEPHAGHSVGDGVRERRWMGANRQVSEPTPDRGHNWNHTRST